MSKQGQLLLGSLLLLWGAILLLGALFQISTGALCWPTALILVGVWLLLRPRHILPGSSIQLHPLGDIHKSGAWQVQDEEIWQFVGDVTIDLRSARIPSGETILRLVGFVGDVEVYLPAGAAAAIDTNAFFTDAKIGGASYDRFLTGVHYASPNYKQAEHKVRLNLTYFVIDLDVHLDMGGSHVEQ
jgi:hypothetical protein